jgi:hypothetical protein
MEVPMIRLAELGALAVAAAAVIAVAHGQDLDAGKTGPQLFAQDCSACHRSPQGLSKNMSGGSLVSFLRQHYTSSASSANAVAAYVQAAGAPRVDPKKGREEAKQPPQSRDHSKQARPSTPTAAPSGEPPQAGRKARDRLARPADPAEPTDRPSRSRRPAGEATEPLTPAAAEAAAAAAVAEAAAAAAAATAADASAAPGSPGEGATPAAAPPAAASPAVAAAPSGFSEPLP